MNEYLKEQWTALNQIKEWMDAARIFNHRALRDEILGYLEFRERLDRFTGHHFGDYCSRACFENQMSACCSKDGIVTFWADHVINAYTSGMGHADELLTVIGTPTYPDKCIYLGASGCVWRIRPLGCALFLCDGVQKDVFGADSSLKQAWDGFCTEAKGYRWPDRVVLFDRLEQVFMAAGCLSPLMYINTSPGLLRVKQRAGIASIPKKIRVAGELK